MKMGQLEEIEDPHKLHILLESVDDNVLEDLIQREKSLEKLGCYLKWKYDRIKKNISERTDFSVKEILQSEEGTPSMKKSVLKWALLIQKTNKEFITCLKCFNKRLSNIILCKRNNIVSSSINVEELFSIAEVILIVKQEREEEILFHVDENNLKILLFELTNMTLNNEYCVNVPTIFLFYFDQVFIKDSNIMNNIVHYLIENENLDFLTMIFDERLNQLAGSVCFQENCLWNLLRSFITSENSIRKKQALFILSKTIDYFKKNNSILIPEDLETKSLDDWNLYFILIHLSKEKQLHLIKPVLKLLPSIENVHISWQLCLYNVLLNHSQLFVVYKTVEHLITLKFEVNESFRYILRNIINALNKHEYSDLSQNAYEKFSNFCNELDDQCCRMLFEEFICIEWNPASAWCFLKCTSSVLYKIPQDLILNMLRTMKSLPHIFIKNGCIYLFLQKLFEKHTGSFLEDVTLIGQFLIFSDSEVDEEIFKTIMLTHKDKFKEKNTELQNKVLESIKNKNEKSLHIYLALMKILQVPMDLNVDIPCSNIGDIILLHFPNLKDTSDVLDFLLKRLESFEDNDYYYISKYLDNLFLEEHKISRKYTFTNEYNEKLGKLWNISKEKHFKSLIAIRVIAESYYFESFIEMLELGKEINSFKNLIPHLYKLWINGRYFPNESNQNENVTTLIKKLQLLLDLDGEQALYFVVQSLELLLKYTSDKQLEELLPIYEGSLMKICELPSALLRSYSVVFFRSIFHLKLFGCGQFLECWKSWDANHFENHFLDSESVMKVILEGCRKLILLDFPNVDIFIPLIIRGLLSGTIVQKNQRVQYGICQEIHTVNEHFLVSQNPNIISMELKMIAIESLYLIVKRNRIDSSRTVVETLLNQYKKHYKTRYFPDSKIHLEKLRIVQALLLVGPCESELKNQVLQFILNSFSDESHQPSVKLLLQWLLIILMSSDGNNHLEVVIERINTASLSNPSSLVALIPVLYHVVVFSTAEKFWIQVTDALLPWTMGANFKLRVYSQVTLRMLLRKAIEKKLTVYLEKYSFLENSISKVLAASGNAVEETLKNDLAFIETFNHELHYSIESIFINVPSILGVPSPEWENIADYKFSDQMDFKIKNDQDFPNITRTADNTSEKTMDATYGINVQTKIIPWKSAFKESEDNKTLGNIICVASLLEKPSNLGGLSRTCEIFCVKQLVLHNWKIKDDKEFKNLSMSSENWVNFMEVKRDDLFEFLMKMKQYNYSLVGLEQTAESVKLNDFKFEKKTVLLLGNEKEGIPAPLLPIMDSCIEIPQFGQTRSLNVHVAGAISIWEYVKQHTSS